MSQYDDLEQHHKFDWGVPSEFEGAMMMVNLRVPDGMRDTFDNDPDTVSEYDAANVNKMPLYGSRAEAPKKDTFDGDENTVSWEDNVDTEKMPLYGSRVQSAPVSDNFDNDPNTVSEYDHMRMTPKGPKELQ